METSSAGPIETEAKITRHMLNRERLVRRTRICSNNTRVEITLDPSSGKSPIIFKVPIDKNQEISLTDFMGKIRDLKVLKQRGSAFGNSMRFFVGNVTRCVFEFPHQIGIKLW